MYWLQALAEHRWGFLLLVLALTTIRFISLIKKNYYGKIRENFKLI